MSSSESHDSPLQMAALERLATMPEPAEPRWLIERRRLAIETLRTAGLPDKKQEGFRFFPLTALTSCALKCDPAIAAGSDSANVFGVPRGTLGLVNGFCNGKNIQLADGVRIDNLSGWLASDPNALEPWLNRLATPTDGFAAFSLAAFYDAWVVDVPSGVAVKAPLCLNVLQTLDGHWSIPRLLVILRPGSSLTLIERHLGGPNAPHALSTGLFELSVGAGAQLTHTTIVTGGAAEAQLTTTAVEVAAGGRYHSWVATLGGNLTRLDLQVHLVGPDARADLDGLYLARGREFADHHTQVVHECPRTTTRELYRGIIDDEAQAVFDGMVAIKPDAQQSDAEQQNRNLVLSDAATVHAKPHLEIEADDVVCSHGATVGQLDEHQLFYLRSRGVDATLAREILTFAFASEVVARCPVPELVPDIHQRLAAGMASVQEMCS
jgi:Fe-S cluster assembly protein SufD